MSQRLRQFMVLMLIALQFAAPLVHAHIGVETGRQAGLHMHELEVFSMTASDPQVLVADKQAVSDDQLVIDLDLAIKPLQHVQDFLALVSWQHEQFLFAADRRPQITRFFHPACILPVTPQLELRSPRAPPV